MTETIVLNPTWEAATRIYMSVLQNPDAGFEAHKSAQEDLLNLARHVDAIKAKQDERDPNTIALFDEGDHDVIWLRNSKGTHTIRYGEQVKRFAKSDDLQASAEFGACVRHSLECAGKLD